MSKNKNKNKELLFVYKELSNRIYWKGGVPIWKYSPVRRLIGNRAGHVNSHGYREIGIRINGRRFKVSAHRLSYFMSRGFLPDLDIDHIDLNKDNNDPNNLRSSSRSDNMYNTNKNSSYGGEACSSSYKGVSWSKRDSKWDSYIDNMGTRHRLGRFEDEIEAALAYDRAARKLGRDFSRLNFPDQI